jgi:hypothetical protein
MSIAGEHLIAQGKAVKGHDKRDAHLLAVRAMIARITALGLRVGFCLALKIGACDVVEQDFVLDRSASTNALPAPSRAPASDQARDKADPC